MNQTKVQYKLYDHEPSFGGSIEYDYFQNVTHKFDPYDKLAALTPTDIFLKNEDFINEILETTPTNAHPKAIETWMKQKRLDVEMLRKYFAMTSKDKENIIVAGTEFDVLGV